MIQYKRTSSKMVGEVGKKDILQKVCVCTSFEVEQNLMDFLNGTTIQVKIKSVLDIMEKWTPQKE